MSDTTNIGLVHNKDLPKDAIHIAIAQVRTGEELLPGDRVGWKDGKEGTIFKTSEAIGIVDPFLTSKVGKDCMVYLFLFPNTITSLTHQWDHPAFNRTPERVKEAEDWLNKHSFGYFSDYGEYPDAEGDNYKHFVEDFKEGNLYCYAYGDDFSEHYNQDKDGFRKKFWDSLEIITGKLATKEQRETEYFSCSC